MAALRMIILPVTLAALAAAAGCGQKTQVGFRPFPVRIKSEPRGLRAYLVPHTEWVKSRLTLSDPKALDFVRNFPVTDGRTPVTTHAPSFAYLVVVEHDGRLFAAREPVVPGQSVPAGEPTVVKLVLE